MGARGGGLKGLPVPGDAVTTGLTTMREIEAGAGGGHRGGGVVVVVVVVVVASLVWPQMTTRLSDGSGGVVRRKECWDAERRMGGGGVYENGLSPAFRKSLLFALFCFPFRGEALLLKH